jgi:hypothetical protein
MTENSKEPTQIRINERVVTEEELESEKKRKDIRLVQESPTSFRELTRLQE